MKRTKSFRYFKDVYLDTNRMNELYSLLIKHCDDLAIEVKTVDNSSIVFDSYDELMAYDNFKKNRIKRLVMRGYSKGVGLNSIIDITFTTEYPLLSTVDYTCNFRSSEDEAVFLSDMQYFLEKSKRSRLPLIFVNVLFIALLSVILFIIIRTFWPDITGNLCFAGGLSIVLGIIYGLAFSDFVWSKFFPPVSFAWGEAVTYYNQLAKIRSNIFWGIIVTFIIGIIVNIISK